ncbi:MAG: pyridoxal 5'-phosphate synthase glutaminase subunit PdxT, partial [Thermoleophilia bacterium]
MLERLGAASVEVRLRHELDFVDALVIPGGESTTIGKLMGHYGLIEPIKTRAAAGMPVFGTCAGLITLAREIVEGDQPVLGLIDIVARRNAFGRQVHSFEADLELASLGPPPLRAVFIRAPWIEHAGPGVEILASLQGHAVAARQGRVLVTAFHPELTGDTRMHEAFLS